MGRTLIAGPWLGEFGWELFNWQAHLRYLSDSYDKVICVVRTGHEFLYHDFADSFINIDDKGEKNGWRLNEKPPKLPLNIIDEYKDAIKLEPCCSFPMDVQKFIQYTSEVDKKYDVLFQCRSTTKLKTEYRNWETEKWNGLKNVLESFKIACVGSREESGFIEGTDDLRGICIKDLVGIMNNARLIIGPSSGTMHLASLCGLTHVVFTDTSIAFDGKYTNRYRYEKGWNPLGTKAIVIDEEGWRPSAKIVINKVKEILK